MAKTIYQYHQEQKEILKKYAEMVEKYNQLGDVHNKLLDEYKNIVIDYQKLSQDLEEVKTNSRKMNVILKQSLTELFMNHINVAKQEMKAYFINKILDSWMLRKLFKVDKMIVMKIKKHSFKSNISKEAIDALNGPGPSITDMMHEHEDEPVVEAESVDANQTK